MYVPNLKTFCQSAPSIHTPRQTGEHPESIMPLTTTTTDTEAQKTTVCSIDVGQMCFSKAGGGARVK